MAENYFREEEGNTSEEEVSSDELFNLRSRKQFVFGDGRRITIHEKNTIPGDGMHERNETVVFIPDPSGRFLH